MATASPGCLVGRAPCQGPALAIPAGGGPRATLRGCWQAVVSEHWNTPLPGKPDMLDCSWQESCPRPPLAPRSRALALTVYARASHATGELLDRLLRAAQGLECSSADVCSGGCQSLPGSPPRRLTPPAVPQAKLVGCGSSWATSEAARGPSRRRTASWNRCALPRYHGGAPWYTTGWLGAPARPCAPARRPWLRARPRRGTSWGGCCRAAAGARCGGRSGSMCPRGQYTPDTLRVYYGYPMGSRERPPSMCGVVHVGPLGAQSTGGHGRAARSDWRCMEVLMQGCGPADAL